MSEEGVFYSHEEDEVMNRAMEKAQETMSYFLNSLAQPQEGQWSFSAKARLVEGEEVEHVWLGDVKPDEDHNFYGTVSNEPVHLKNIKLGSQVLVEEKDITDWMIVERGRLIGGYTVRVYRDGMEPQAQEDFDRTLGLLIDEGVDHFPHDFNTPEGAILCLEDAYTAGDIEAAVACKHFRREAGHLLSRIPELPQNSDILENTAETLEEAFRAYLREGDMPNFEGIDRAFPLREYEDDDTVLVTEICHLPDGSKTMDKIWTYRVDGQWKVGPPANEDA